MKFQVLETNTINETIRLLARWHNETPKQWIQNYTFTEQDVISTVNRMVRDTSVIILAEEDRPIGFIWGEKQNQDLMILSLYVDENFRKHQVATDLKLQLETWCRNNDIQKILTTVHSKNKNMLALNEKLGYEQKMIHMEKKLR